MPLVVLLHVGVRLAGMYYTIYHIGRAVPGGIHDQKPMPYLAVKIRDHDA